MSNNANTALLESLFDKWLDRFLGQGFSEQKAEQLAAVRAEVEFEQIPTPWV